MSLSIQDQVTWTDILVKNKKVIEAVIADAMSRCPQVGKIENLSTEQVAMISMEKKGFESAIETVFATIPKDRPVNTKSSFMDMTVS